MEFNELHVGALHRIMYGITLKFVTEALYLHLCGYCDIFNQHPDMM